MLRFGSRVRLRWIAVWAAVGATVVFAQQQQPVIAENGVMNAASYGVISAPGAGIAPGSIFVIFGTGLGPDSLVRAPEYPLRTELAGTSVRLGDTPAFILYTSATQVAGVAPSSLSTGNLLAVTVSFNGRSSQPVRVPVVETDFGIFTRNAAGYGQAAAQTVSLSDGAIWQLGLAAGVRAGEPVVLYGTGLGAIAGAPDDRPPGAAQTAVPVEIVVGGQIVRPSYAGRSPAFAGLDQINFTLPAAVVPGCYIALAVRAHTRLSNVVSIPVVAAGTAETHCRHAFGLARGALEALDAGRTIVAALAIMERQSSPSGLSAGAGIGFATMTPNQVEEYVAPTADPYDPLGPPGSCVVLPIDRNRTVPFHPSHGRPVYLDAGATVRLTGPGFSTDLPRVSGSGYGSNLAGGVLSGGAWTYAGSGGSDVASFQATFHLPDPPFTWTNRMDRIDPMVPLRLEWTGGGTDPVRIVGAASAQSGTEIRGGSFLCLARTEDGGFTIPPRVLAVLPAGSTGGLILTQRTTTRGDFLVPLVRGGNADGSAFQLTSQASGPIQVAGSQ